MEYQFFPPKQKSSDKSPVLLLLHGVGANEGSLAGLAEYVDPRFAVYSLRAPLTLAAGSFAWFQVNFTAQGPLHNKEQAESSRLLLKKFIQGLGTDASLDGQQVYILGFSQGAIMGLSLALTEPDLVKGVVAIGGRTLQEISAQALGRKYAVSPQVLLVHGVQDNKLPLFHAQASEETLKKAGLSYEFKTYEAGHEINGPMIQDIQAWLQKNLR